VSHPYYHALSAARHFGGEWQDYVEVERWFDQTKGHIADARHRLLLHNEFGVELCEEIFGETLLRPSDGKQIGVSEVARRHVEEDFGGHVPAVDRCFRRATLEGWMQEACGFPTDVLAARRFGGVPADYQEIRNWFERAEGRCPDGRARLLLTHTFGIFLCEQRFGPVLTRASDGVRVPTRPIAEAYVLRVFRGRIPTAGNLLEKVPLEAWMGAHARPLSKELSAPLN
jgi:hypothetical protein